jgi:hypothetical protein
MLIDANSLDAVTNQKKVTIFAIIGITCCGKTHLADALVKKLREVRCCFPIFIDEVAQDTQFVVEAAIRGATPFRPVILAGQTYRDVSAAIDEPLRQGTAIVLCGKLNTLNDSQALSLQFGIDQTLLSGIEIPRFLALHKTKA